MQGSAISVSSAAEGVRPQARRLPIGAEYLGNDRAHVRVWAPAANKVEVVLHDRATQLDAAPGGYFSGTIGATPGNLYQFRLDDQSQLFPDPASRFQPQGPHGPSEVIDSTTFEWTDASWRGIPLEGQVFYEMHVGTFTREGSWAAVMRELPELADLGITTIEVMPVAEFDGRFGWGYDGVDLFAPTHLYGRPDDFRRMVYATGVRQRPDGVFGAFDCPDGGQIAPKRTHSTTPLQALNLLNSSFMMQASGLFAERLEREVGNEVNAQVRRGFALAFQREASAEETKAAAALVRDQGLKIFCRGLLNANEFVYVD